MTVQIFRRIQALIDLPNQKHISIVNFFIVLNRLTTLIKIEYAVLREIFLFNAEIALLLLKITVVRPYVNGIFFKASFFCSYRCLNTVIRENVFFVVEILFESLMA